MKRLEKLRDEVIKGKVARYIIVALLMLGVGTPAFASGENSETNSGDKDKSTLVDSGETNAFAEAGFKLPELLQQNSGEVIALPEHELDPEIWDLFKSLIPAEQLGVLDQDLTPISYGFEVGRGLEPIDLISQLGDTAFIRSQQNLINFAQSLHQESEAVVPYEIVIVVNQDNNGQVTASERLLFKERVTIGQVTFNPGDIFSFDEDGTPMYAQRTSVEINGVAVPIDRIVTVKLDGAVRQYLNLFPGLILPDDVNAQIEVGVDANGRIIVVYTKSGAVILNYQEVNQDLLAATPVPELPSKVEGVALARLGAASADGAGEGAADNVSSPELAASVFTRETLPEEWREAYAEMPAQVMVWGNGASQTWNVSPAEFREVDAGLEFEVNGRRFILTKENGLMIEQFHTDGSSGVVVTFFLSDDAKDKASREEARINLEGMTFPIAIIPYDSFDMRNHPQRANYDPAGWETRGVPQENFDFSLESGSRAIEKAFTYTYYRIYLEQSGEQMSYEEFEQRLINNTINLNITFDGQAVTNFSAVDVLFHPNTIPARGSNRAGAGVDNGQMVFSIGSIGLGSWSVQQTIPWICEQIIAENTGLSTDFLDSFYVDLIKILLPMIDGFRSAPLQLIDSNGTHIF